MKHLKPLNKRAMKLSGDEDRPDVFGYACSICCTAWAPGWEVGNDPYPVDPCPWMSDLSLCWVTCYWTGQVADDTAEPDWLDDCSLVSEDWVRICVVPD
jgi:hypothetical protein